MSTSSAGGSSSKSSSTELSAGVLVVEACDWGREASSSYTTGDVMPWAARRVSTCLQSNSDSSPRQQLCAELGQSGEEQIICGVFTIVFPQTLQYLCGL